MVDPQTKPVAVPNRKRVNADIVDGTTPETPVLKKSIKSTPPAVPAAASPRVTRAASQRKLSAHQAKKIHAELKRSVVQAEEATPQCQLEAAQGEQTTPQRQQEAVQGEQATPQLQQEATQGEHAVCRGHLDRMKGRITIVIPPRKTRPLHPKIASMYATCCSLAVKKLVPILPHWKGYKDRHDIFSQYDAFLCSKFKLDLQDPWIRRSLLMNLQYCVRQRRHFLKKRYFDHCKDKATVARTPPLQVKHMSQADWCKLVDKWSTTWNEVTCLKARMSKNAIRFPSATGSHSYEVACNISEADAFELFKATHYSGTRGFTSPVKTAFAKMEREMEPSTSADGTVKEPLSAAKVVADVLCRGNRKPSFLRNIGVIPSHTSAPMIQLQLQFDSEKKRR